ncbi:MAG: hypothetical protein CVT98_02695 [Bacteroidetes bacterium HGW-Bacteroidetes-15]|nr:MAG: hypothetical protein CVT98_02695 [Bacteroidetes bacterium HGW-Bacteroidetes-15]
MTTAKPKPKLERAAFESSSLIDNQTNVLFNKGTLEMVMNHRFGLINGGENDLAGIWGATNIRIAFAYSITDRITVGYGTTKDNRLQDFSLKGAILRQTRGNEMPVSVTYYGNFTIDARKKENFFNTQDRYSSFNELIIARRFSRVLSFQVSPSWSHFNIVEDYMHNDVIALAVGGRVKISPSMSLMAEYTQAITTYEQKSPDPGISAGIEFSTGSHAFQIYLANYKGIIPQKNIMFNQNNFFKGDFLIGFNITRLWHF